ncbi:thermonuclease family protein [Paracoccus sp. Ld10]|uniref:thermonuclease family protein n=1 Tax=Paracoccus sp. Ld10 TaxID=649158 RepID=UPI003870D4C6
MLGGGARVIDVDGKRIRLHGIDALESGQTCRRRSRIWECGVEATRALERLIGISAVTCKKRATDRYGLMVAICDAGGRNLNARMVRQGYAVAYFEDGGRAYAADEAIARASHAGIWSGRFVTPADWRKGRRLVSPALIPQRDRWIGPTHHLHSLTVTLPKTCVSWRHTCQAQIVIGRSPLSCRVGDIQDHSTPDIDTKTLGHTDGTNVDAKSRTEQSVTLHTPDGRYIVVRGRLWRATDPDLPEAEQKRLTRELMDARRAVKAARSAHDGTAEDAAHRAVDRAKQALGERGPVWWSDGAPDMNRKMARNTPYAEWFCAQTEGDEQPGS